MKKYMGIVMVGLLAGMAVPASADSEWGVFGSYWSPSDGDDGFGGGIKIGAEMVDRVQLDLRYSFVSNVGNSDDVNLDVQPLELGLQYAIPVGEDIEPYLGVGIGYYLMDGKAGGQEIDDEFGVYFSTGVEFTLSRSKAQYGQTSTKLFLEAMYRNVEPDGVDLRGFGAQAGLLIGW